MSPLRTHYTSIQQVHSSIISGSPRVVAYIISFLHTVLLALPG
jgi:hypothetical protein